jgi:hypothetical protein
MRFFIFTDFVPEKREYWLLAERLTAPGFQGKKQLKWA